MFNLMVQQGWGGAAFLITKVSHEDENEDPCFPSMNVGMLEWKHEA